MNIVSLSTDNRWNICLQGELDASNSLQVFNAIDQAWKGGATLVMINCQELKYISSAGLGVFLAHMPQKNNPAQVLVLFNVSRKIKVVFNILGLESLIPIVQSEEEASAFHQNHFGNNGQLMQG